MSFWIYKEKIYDLVIEKAKNNSDNAADITLYEIDYSIKATPEIMRSLTRWLNEQEELIETAEWIGGELIHCIVHAEYIDAYTQEKL